MSRRIFAKSHVSFLTEGAEPHRKAADMGRIAAKAVLKMASVEYI